MLLQIKLYTKHNSWKSDTACQSAGQSSSYWKSLLISGGGQYSNNQELQPPQCTQNFQLELTLEVGV